METSQSNPLKGSIVLITGATGSFGSTVLQYLMSKDAGEIRLFSRDEKKQDDLRKRFRDERLKFFIGDVRDPGSIGNAMRGVEYLFHAAALKQVPSCEFHPLEAVKTNILGTENTLEAALQCGVRRVVCLSTDKAVYPINAMGISKAMMEKVFVAKSRNNSSHGTVICGTRYGNVMASRGSVIPLFISQIRSGTPITITDPSMTRFMMSLDDAVELVLYAFKNGRPGDIFVQKSPASTILTLAKALVELFGVANHPVNVIGTRHGEKAHETLLSREEMSHAEDLQEYFRIPPDLRDLNYEKYVEVGEKEIESAKDYTSENTRRLNQEEMKALLLKLPFVQRALSGNLEMPEA
jgi:UDP-N-acetylglucosamine 4,6-dehydratase